MPAPPGLPVLSTGDLGIEVARSPSELARAREQTTDRLALERHLSTTYQGRDSWTLPAVCKACDLPVELEVDWLYSDGQSVNFRERLVCPRCGLNNRQRFMAQLLKAARAPAASDAPIYLYEQVTPFFAWAVDNLPGPVVGSEYLGPDVAPGTTVDGVRHEDALALSFPDASLAAMVSNDVFEHVPDIDAAFEECARVLRPGSPLYFSIPFHETPETVQRSMLREGRVVQLLPPQFHGNPLDPEGSLVFYDHGWDVLDRCRAAGFEDAYVLCYWSMLYGYLGAGFQLVFVAIRG